MSGQFVITKRTRVKTRQDTGAERRMPTMTATLPPVVRVTCPTCRCDREVKRNTVLKYHKEGPKQCVGCVRATGWGPKLDPKPTHCRHCSKNKVTRSRGLCDSCFYTPEVKTLYPPTSAYARLGVGNGNASRPLPSKPTDALPGTPEKVAVLAAVPTHTIPVDAATEVVGHAALHGIARVVRG